MTVRIALVGDFSPDVLAHRAIERCFTLARESRSHLIESRWLATETILPGDDRMLAQFEGIWCVPASPYRNMAGALWVIQYARTHAVPFLGTCGGYQHALLEYARNVLGLKTADHAETNPDTAAPLLNRMHCSLIEQSQQVVVTNDEFRAFYGADSGLEGFHCSYGLNSSYEQVFTGSSLEIVARSADGQARAFRLKDHPFFIGTQFQPERKALAGSIHPIIRTFFSVAATQRSR